MEALALPLLALVAMRERHIDLSRVPRGPAVAFPIGMAFAAGIRDAGIRDAGIHDAGIHDGSAVQVLVSRDSGARWQRP